MAERYAARKRHADDPGDGNGTKAKRQMVTRACDACKQRRCKCSGTLPCTNCAKRGIPCAYESRYSRGKPPTPQPTTPAVISGTAPSVSPRSSAAQPPSTSASTQHRRRAEPPLSQGEPPQTPPGPSRASPVFGVTEIQGQYVEPTSGLAFLHRAWKRLSRQQQPRAVVDDQLVSGHERLQQQDRAGDKAYELDSSSNSSQVLPMPDLATCRQLVGYYHDLCVATYRFLHRPSVDAWVAQAHTNLDYGLPLEHGIGEMKASVVLSVLAVATFHQGKSSSRNSPVAVTAERAATEVTVGTAVSTTATADAPSAASTVGTADGDAGSDRDDTAVSMRKSDGLFLAGMRIAAAARGYPALDSVQARLVQVLYLLHTSRLNEAWYVFGHALQTLAALGLHRRGSRGRSRPAAATAIRPSGDYIEAQCRKRTFWTAYVLDAYLGIMFGRPRHFHDANIDQDLPDAINDEDMAADGPCASTGSSRDCAIESLIFHARIGRIVGHISQSVYAINQDLGDALVPVIQAIRADLDAWTASLPPILSAVNPSCLVYPFRRQATTMRLARAHAIMHLNRPFLLRPPAAAAARPDHRAISSRAVADCVAAAREVLGIVDHMAQDGTLFYAFWWTHYVAFCALTVVYIWAMQKKNAPVVVVLQDRGPVETSDGHDDGVGDDAGVPDSGGLFALAETCQHHLAKATALNAPSGRYTIILEELRQEAMARTVAVHGNGGPYTAQPPMSTRPLQGPPPVPALQAGPFLSTTQTVPPLPQDMFSPTGRSQLEMAAVVGPMQGSTGNGTPLQMSQSQWGGWQTVDWVDIDALALDPFAGFTTSPGAWMPGSFTVGNFQ